MNNNVFGFWENIKSKGFFVYFSIVFSLMFLTLFLIDLIFNRLVGEEPFNIIDFFWWDFPVNIIVSILFALFSWKYGNKRLKLKSNITEIKLNEDNEKEKQIFKRQKN
ncbi:hypothetical protein BH20ACI1_BH20ACI1_05230 [soil metagenome]